MGYFMRLRLTIEILKGELVPCKGAWTTFTSQQIKEFVSKLMVYEKVILNKDISCHKISVII